MKSRLGRATVYSLAGFAFEVVFSTLHDVVRGKPITFRTSPWMLPIYALVQPLYEPLHDKLRGRVPAPARASIYAAGIMSVEYASGKAYRTLLGEAPWDYTYARRHIDGLVRPDYFPLWATGGLLLEPLHDALTSNHSAD